MPAIDSPGLFLTALSTPLVSLALAVIVSGVVLVVRSPQSNDTSSVVGRRYQRERSTVGSVAASVAILFIAENLVRSYSSTAAVLTWWEYAVPLILAAVGSAVVLVLISTRGTRKPEQPTLSSTRRTWSSSSRPSGLVLLGLASAALTVTTVLAGIASVADDQGRFVQTAITIPNAEVDPIRPWFYGWAFGIPVLLSLVVLALVVWVTLRANSLRPFVAPSSVAVERRFREQIADAVVGVGIAAILLTLGAALRSIAEVGRIQQLVVAEGSGDVAYDTFLASRQLVDLMAVAATGAEIAAFSVLIVIAARLLKNLKAAGQTRGIDAVDRVGTPV